MRGKLKIGWMLLGVALLFAGRAIALTDAEFQEMMARQGSAAAPAQASGTQPPVNLATQPAPASATPTLAGLLGRLGIALGAVFGVMFLVVWAMRKYMPRNALLPGGAAIEILATRPLGQRRSLLLVRARGRTLLLGATPEAINLISELDEAQWDAAALHAGLEEARA